jgi:hypothetical protein
MSLVAQLDDQRSKSRQQLSRLVLLAHNYDVMALSPQAGADIREATNAVIAQVEATSRAMIEDGRHERGAETFLWARVTRLAAAADHAVGAARRGDAAELRAQLRHFETLTLALWTVQDAI